MPHEKGAASVALPEPDLECRWESDGRLGGRLVLGGGQGRRSALRAWSFLWTAAGLNATCWAVMGRRRSGLTVPWASALGVGRLRSVVLLGDLCAVVDLGDQLLLG